MNVIGTGGRIARLGACTVKGTTAMVSPASPASRRPRLARDLERHRMLASRHGSLNYDSPDAEPRLAPGQSSSAISPPVIATSRARGSSATQSV